MTLNAVLNDSYHLLSILQRFGRDSIFTDVCNSKKLGEHGRCVKEKCCIR